MGRDSHKDRAPGKRNDVYTTERNRHGKVVLRGRSAMSYAVDDVEKALQLARTTTLTDRRIGEAVGRSATFVRKWKARTAGGVQKPCLHHNHGGRRWERMNGQMRDYLRRLVIKYPSAFYWRHARKLTQRFGVQVTPNMVKYALRKMKITRKRLTKLYLE